MAMSDVAELLAEDTGRAKDAFEPPADAEYPPLDELEDVDAE